MAARIPAPFLPVLLLIACGGPGLQEWELRGTTMGTTYVVKYVGEQPRDSVRKAVDAGLEAFNGIFSTYIPDSEISRFNVGAAGISFPASESFQNVVVSALRIAEATDGAFDPTIMPLVAAYGFGPDGERRIPTEQELEAARGWTGWRKLEIDGDGLRKSLPEVELDLSAIAKGAGVDRVAALLREMGIESFMVEIGGEVYCAGEKARGDPWTIGIEGPPGVEPVVARVALMDQAMATSGSYRNYVEGRNGRVHHVLDPRTGRNAGNGVVSVSVIAPDCALADGLATAFMVLGPDRAQDVVRAYGGQEIRALFLIAGKDGTITKQGLNW